VNSRFTAFFYASKKKALRQCIRGLQAINGWEGAARLPLIKLQNCLKKPKNCLRKLFLGSFLAAALKRLSGNK
jgi:hypothetical protein